MTNNCLYKNAGNGKLLIYNMTITIYSGFAVNTY